MTSFSNKRLFLSILVVICGFLGTGMPSAVLAQLSPGDLTHAHAELDGLRKCKKCHDFGNREVRQGCLDCHGEIQAMRTEKKGLHSQDEFDDCANCHVEHNGADYDLIAWDGGQDSFEHRRAGFTLAGKHAELACRKCHTVKYAQEPLKWRSMGKDLNRTFLGLDSACKSCHEDHHQGQLGDDCLKCHDQRDWKKQPLFDHARAKFPLTGLHAKVDCAKCHKPEPVKAGGSPTPRYTNLVFAACTDCHKDPHEGRLGGKCIDCHNTGGWLKLATDKFDHDRTKYPLRGRHTSVTCEKCHGNTKSGDGLTKPAYAACKDCHRDEHGGLAREHAAWLTCENCHDLEGFRPSRYPLQKHRESAYSLEGSHLAVACGQCHRRPGPTGAAKLDLAPARQDCRDCHDNPHEKSAASGDVFAGLACSSCHVPATWRQVSGEGGFDHGKTRFPLDGRHRPVSCRGCHVPDAEHKGNLLFNQAPRDCNGCHKDVHGAQFADRLVADSELIDCGHCHVTTDWLAEKFNHETDARFALKGGHERTPCAGCHKPETGPDGVVMTRYKPLPMECRACHDAQPGEGSTGS